MLVLAVGDRVALPAPSPNRAWRLAYLPPGLRCDGASEGAFLFTAVFPAQDAIELIGPAPAGPGALASLSAQASHLIRLGGRTSLGPADCGAVASRTHYRVL